MLNSGLKLNFCINGSYYHGATVRLTHQKFELFYHYPWGSRQETGVYNQKKNVTEHGYLPDHISFHNDGTVHTKSRDSSKKTVYNNSVAIGQNFFDLDRAQFLPILLESIDISEKSFLDKRFKEVETPDKTKEALWDLRNVKSFSILIICKCARLNPANMIKDHGFQNLKIIGSSVVMADAFTANDKINCISRPKTNFDTQILIMAVENIWDDFAKSIVVDNGVEPSCFTCTVTLPPMEKLGQLPLSINR